MEVSRAMEVVVLVVAMLSKAILVFPPFEKGMRGRLGG